jgi:hypothetical protein
VALVAPVPRSLSLRTASLILLITLVAQLSFLDHVFVVAPANMSEEATHSHTDHGHGGSDAASDAARGHTLHCHGGLATCSDLPLAAGPGQILFGSEFLLPALMADFELGELEDSRVPSEANLPPLSPPPQVVLRSNTAS